MSSGSVSSLNAGESQVNQHNGEDYPDHTPMESSPRSPENVAMMSPQIYRSSTGSSAKFKDSECASCSYSPHTTTPTHSPYTITPHTQPVHHYPPTQPAHTTPHTQLAHHYPPHTARTPLPSTHSPHTITPHTQPVHHYPPHTARTHYPPHS